MKDSTQNITMTALQAFETLRADMHQDAHDRYQARLSQIQADYAAETTAIEKRLGFIPQDDPEIQPAPTGTLLSASVEEGHYD